MVRFKHFSTALLPGGRLFRNFLVRGDLLQRQHTVRSGTSILGDGAG